MTQIPVIVGQPPEPHLPEYREMLKYESGRANEIVAGLPGRHQDPWLNALDLWEPASPLALEKTLQNPATASAVQGRVLDVAAGSCWATARLSLVESVQEVVALDLSAGFLTSVGDRIINELSGERRKIRFAVSSFNTMPFEDEYFDCSFFIATLHHCETPIRTLKEICRTVKGGGTLFLIEISVPPIRIREAREHALQASRETGFTEIAQTRSEMEYLIRHAGFDLVAFHTFKTTVGGSLKQWVRTGLRRLRLEHVLLHTLYVMEAKKIKTQN
jgi:ubiquinone/menaquinone biosynthesis C-methylase UbiE